MQNSLRRLLSIRNTPWGREAVAGELQRSRVMAVTLFSILLLSGADFIFYRNSYTTGGAPPYALAAAWLLLFIAYELWVLRRIRWFQKHRFNLPPGFNYITGVVEVSFPSLLLFYLSVHQRMPWLLDSPFFLFYFLALLLSVLHLNRRLCLFVAAVAAVQYAVIAYLVYHQSGTWESPLPENTHYIKSIILLLSGFLAGFVAQQMNRRMELEFRAVDERNNLAVHFGQQVSSEVAAALLEQGDEARRLNVTVMVLDVRNFTTLVEHFEPGEILRLQNRLFSPLINIIGQHKGIVNQVLGDGLMATFGAPVADLAHPAMAFDAAKAALEWTEQLNASGELPHIRLGIGLHCGEVTTGNIGNNLRKQWSVSGLPVIVAFRLEQLNKELGTQLVVSGDMRNRLGLAQKDLRSRGRYTLKGMEESVEVFSWERGSEKEGSERMSSN